MIVFLCAHVRISISTYITVIYLPIGLHQVTPLGVVFLFMLVNWWVEKHQRFFIQRLQTFFFIFVTFFLMFLTYFYFFSGTFFTSMAHMCAHHSGKKFPSHERWRQVAQR